MIDVKRRVEQKKAEAKKVYESGTKNVRAQTRQKSQNWDDDNESASDSEYEPLRIARYPAVGARNNELEAGPSHRNVSSTPVTVTGTQIGAKSSDGEHSNAELAEEINVGKARSVPNVSDGAEASNISKKGGALKEAKIGDESQDWDEAGLRKSSRKRTALTNFGGVMIYSIFKNEAKQGGRREGTGHKLRW